MLNKKTIIIISIVVVIFAGLGLFFTLQNNSSEETLNQNTQANFDFVKEDQVSEGDSAEYFESFGLSKLKVTTYGGPADIKTLVQNNSEYALTKNPQSTGGLTFALSNEMGEFYFAQDENSSKILYPEGTSEGKFGYEDVGLVSGILTRERIPSAEYYAAYPSEDLSSQMGFEAYRDDGSTNRFLNSKYLKITNLNNNRQVIVQIDTRHDVEGSLLISEATRKALLVDNGIMGSFSLEVVEKENNTLGVVRR